MSVADLYNIPTNKREQAIWTFSNAASHTFIQNALAAKNPGMQFDNWVLDPLDDADVQRFLLSHQLMHNQLDLLLNIGGNDYTQLDPTKPGSVEIIWLQHAQEHIQAESLVRMS